MNMLLTTLEKLALSSNILTSKVSAPSVLAILHVSSSGIWPKGFLFTSFYNNQCVNNQYLLIFIGGTPLSLTCSHSCIILNFALQILLHIANISLCWSVNNPLLCTLDSSLIPSRHVQSLTWLVTVSSIFHNCVWYCYCSIIWQREVVPYIKWKWWKELESVVLHLTLKNSLPKM